MNCLINQPKNQPRNQHTKKIKKMFYETSISKVFLVQEVKLLRKRHIRFMTLYTGNSNTIFKSFRAVRQK